MTKMAAMSIHRKNIKNSSSPEPLGRLLETWYVASGKFFKVYINDEPRLTDLFYGNVKFGP